MRERPILFSAPMVQKILANRKRVTRRLVVPQPHESTMAFRDIPTTNKWYAALARDNEYGTEYTPVPEHGGYTWTCRYGVPGDQLYVKENWAAVHFEEDDIHGSHDIPPAATDYWSIQYAADGDEFSCKEDRGWSWRPSIHMPRWASRIDLKVEDIRIERLQDITEEDAIAEGAEPWAFGPEQCMTSGERGAASPYRGGFACLWDDINENRATWYSNPFVWRIQFERIK